ncbi:MAG: hypothetical protein PF689_11175 [Deltaproteobacteria bacterium]|jgi:hypothetical protein|nr:hypothetical protein [Deltaproteobacteria bacterium]
MKLAKIITLAISLTVLSCTLKSEYVNISNAPVTIEASEYFEILERWKRKKKIIKKFDTTLEIHSVLLSWEFSRAYNEKYSSLFDLNETDKQNLWNKQKNELKKHIQFIVSAGSTEEEWNDLEKGYQSPQKPGKESNGSIWKITLSVDNIKNIKPVEIKKLRISKIHKSFFPFISHFHKLYVIKFPAEKNGHKILSSKTKKIILHFNGILGKTNLVWLTTNSYISLENE